MATASLTELFQNLLRGSIVRDAGPTDARLVEIFIARRDDLAFEALVRRHGPMVLGICNRILRNPHDAEDAFQATFLVLACKAHTVRPRQMVAGWLHGVACNTALRLRRMIARRRVKEKESAAMPRPEATPELWRRLEPLLDEELRGLPDKYRVPIVLCDLEGKSRKEAARQLGWPEGTVASRLARARQLLAKRLGRRGLVLSVGALTAAISENQLVACVPPALVIALTQAAPQVAAGKAAAVGVLSARVTALTQGVLTAMFVTKLKIATATLLVLGILALSAGYYSSAASPQAGAGVEPQSGSSTKNNGTHDVATDKPGARQPEARSPAALDLPEVMVDEVDLQANSISVTIGWSQNNFLLANMPSASTTSSGSAGNFGITTSSSSSGTSTTSSIVTEKPARLVNLPLGKDAKITIDNKKSTLGRIKTGMAATLQLTLDGKRLVVASVIVDKHHPNYLAHLKQAIEKNARELQDARVDAKQANAMANAELELAKKNLALAQGRGGRAEQDAGAKAAEATRVVVRTLDQGQTKIGQLEALGQQLREELESIVGNNKKN